jgi:Ca2+-binding RTX toxin-like protein
LRPTHIGYLPARDSQRIAAVVSKIFDDAKTTDDQALLRVIAGGLAAIRYAKRDELEPLLREFLHMAQRAGYLRDEPAVLELLREHGATLLRVMDDELAWGQTTSLMAALLLEVFDRDAEELRTVQAFRTIQSLLPPAPLGPPDGVGGLLEKFYANNPTGAEARFWVALGLAIMGNGLPGIPNFGEFAARYRLKQEDLIDRLFSSPREWITQTLTDMAAAVRAGTDLAAVGSVILVKAIYQLLEQTTLHKVLVGTAVNAIEGAAFVASTVTHLNEALLGTAKSVANGYSELILKLGGALVDFGSELKRSTLDQFVSELRSGDPVSPFSVAPGVQVELLLGAPASIVESAAQAILIRPGTTANPFAGAQVDPETLPNPSDALIEGGARGYTLFLPHSAAPGGQRVLLRFVGTDAAPLEVLAQVGWANVGASGEIELVVPEGRRELPFALRVVRATDLDADATVTIDATLVDPAGAATHRTTTELVLEVDADVDDGFVRPATELAIIGADRWFDDELYNYRDELVGSSRNERFEGRLGNDLIAGYEGDDEISGGPGDDYLRGDGPGLAGADLLYGGPGADVLVADGGDDLLFGDESRDLDQAVAALESSMSSSQKGDWLAGNKGDDVLVASSANDVVTGGGGRDSLYGGPGDDYLMGDADYIPIDTDWSFYLRGDGKPSYFAAEDPERNEPVDAGDDSIWAGAGDDWVSGGRGDDFLSGDSGADLLFGDDGVDVLLGGDGDDRISAGSSQSVDVASTEAEYLDGSAGDDRLWGGAGDCVLIGGDGNDFIQTGGGADYVDAGSGDDIVSGYGADTVDAGDGHDSVLVQGTSAVTLRGGAGNDRLESDLGDDRLFGGVGADILIGDAGADYLNGGEGDDQYLLLAGSGQDVISDPSGNDLVIIYSNERPDAPPEARLSLESIRLQSGQGRHYLVYGSAGDRVEIGPDFFQTIERVELHRFDPDSVTIEQVELSRLLVSWTGGAEDDELVGDLQAANDLSGAGGADRLTGGLFSDRISGGPGDDILRGSEGGDTYFFDFGHGVDTIIDDGESGVDIVEFGPGIGPEDLSLGIGSLLIRVGSGGDVLHIEGFDPDDAYGSSAIERFRFADGTELTHAALIERGFDLAGTAGDHYVIGTSASDRFSNDPGSDLLWGGRGADTYHFAPGDGQDLIVDRDDSDGIMDVLELGEGIRPEDVSVAKVGDLMRLSFAGAEDVVDIEWRSDLGSGIALVRFVVPHSGEPVTEWSASTLEAMADSGNHPPVIVRPIDDHVVAEDTAFDFSVPPNFVHDADMPERLAFAATLVGGAPLPEWLRFDNQELTFFGLAQQAHVGEYQIEVEVTDGAGPCAASAFTLTVVERPDAPIVSGTIDHLEATEDISFTFALPSGVFSDEDPGDTLTYRLAGVSGVRIPDWLRIDPVTGTLFGTPGEADFGPSIVAVTATDATGLSAEAGIALFVAAVADAPVVVNPFPDLTVLDQGYFELSLTPNAFADSDPGDLLVYSATLVDGSALPAWLELNPLDWTLSGTAQSGFAGDYTIRVSATDRFGLSVSDDFKLTIPEVNEPPVANDWATSVTEDYALKIIGSVTFAHASDPDGDELSVVRVGDARGGTVQLDDLQSILFTPWRDYSGPASFQYTVTDGIAEATATVRLDVVSMNDAPIAHPELLTAQTAIEGGFFQFVLPEGLFTDIDSTGLLRYSASLVDGTPLPGWLDIDERSGAFWGTPTYSDGGSSEIGISAFDGYESASAVFPLTVMITSILGTAANDRLIGSSNADTLVGLSGADTLDGRGGVDRLFGGPGNDSYYVDNVGDRVIEATAEGTDRVYTLIDYVLPADVESVTLRGAAVHATGNALNNALGGNALDNWLLGGEGNDTLNGGPGADRMSGGRGNDSYYVDQSGDSVWEGLGEGIDRVHSSIDYTLPENFEYLTLTGSALFGAGNTLDNSISGNAHGDILWGFEGADRLNGAAGADTMLGGLGDDSYYVDAADDLVVEMAGEGTDRVYAYISYTLGCSLENLTLVGTAANGFGNASANSMTGNGAANFLVGFAGADSISGGLGIDVVQGGADDDSLSESGGANLLDGGGGDDSLTGGAGSDLLIGGLGNDSLRPRAGANLIAFNRGDGQDVLVSTAGASNVLSLGGGIAYENVKLQKDSNRLVIHLGNGEKLTFNGWYQDPNLQTVREVQFIAEAMAGFSPGGSDWLRDEPIERFDFRAIVEAFDEARAAGFSGQWAIVDALAAAHLATPDGAALGGDLAYRYGTNAGLGSIGLGAAQSILAEQGFGSSPQTLRPIDELIADPVRLIG